MTQPSILVVASEYGMSNNGNYVGRLNGTGDPPRARYTVTRHVGSSSPSQNNIINRGLFAVKFSSYAHHRVAARPPRSLVHCLYVNGS